QACDGIDAVEAVACGATVSRRHNPTVGIEPNGPDRQPGPLSQLTDRIQRVAAHTSTLASLPSGDSSPPPHPPQAAPLRVSNPAAPPPRHPGRPTASRLPEGFCSSQAGSANPPDRSVRPDHKA